MCSSWEMKITEKELRPWVLNLLKESVETRLCHRCRSLVESEEKQAKTGNMYNHVMKRLWQSVSAVNCTGFWLSPAPRPGLLDNCNLNSLFLVPVLVINENMLGWLTYWHEPVPYITEQTLQSESKCQILQKKFKWNEMNGRDGKSILISGSKESHWKNFVKAWSS